jgi:hypothetical protein
MTNVVAGIFIGLVHQVRALPSRWSAFCQDLLHTLAAEESRLVAKSCSGKSLIAKL